MTGAMSDLDVTSSRQFATQRHLRRMLSTDLKCNIRLFCISLLSVSLVACGGGDDDDDGGGGGGTGTGTVPVTVGNDDVEQTLSRLGISAPDSNRVNAAGDDLPESYTPLGASHTLQQKSELFLAGLGRGSATDHVNLLKFLPGVSNVQGQPTTEDRTTALPTTPLDTAWKATNFNASAGGDIDGDGFDEVVLVWHDPNTMAIRLKVFDDESENFIESSESTLTTANPSWLALLTGDFDGNGSDQIALAIVDDTVGSVELHFLNGSKSTSYTITAGLSKTWSATESNSQLGIEMASGRLDRDAGEELVVVINETFGNGQNQSPGNGKSNYYIYDDESADFTELASELVVRVVNNTAFTGVTGTVALGDIDGDSLDEIVIAALDRFSLTCDDVTTVQFAIDDLDAGLVDLAAGTGVADIFSCESSGNNGHTEHLWADTLNIDEDQYAEIQINGVLYDDFVNASPMWAPMMIGGVEAEVPTTYIFKTSSGNGRLQIARDNTVITVGDVTADGRDDIIIYRPAAVRVGTQTSGNSSFAINEPAVSIWGVDPLTGEFGNKYNEVLETLHSGAQAGGPPMVLAVNVDNDSTVLKYGAGSHRLIYSEPIVHAALASPPCWNTGIQVTENCRTSWGTGTSSGTSESNSHTVTGKFHTGFEAGVSLPIVGDIKVEVEETVGLGLGSESSYGYELTRTHTFTTGAQEDTVIATVVPFDQYTFEILSHPVFPELVGEDVVISLPRRPRTIQIERQFYNANIVGEGVRVDDSIFRHTIGDPRSYPGSSERNASGATSFGPFDIGTSSGSQEAEISESRVQGFNRSVSLSYEATIKGTAGSQMRGFSIGTDSTSTLGVSTGSSVVFRGSVGDIPPNPALTANDEYSFGIFVYQQSSGVQDRPFQVINYWVE